MFKIKFRSYFLGFWIVCNPLFAQEGENPLPWSPKPITFDTAAAYPGGSAALMQYFRDSVRYSSNPASKTKSGHVLAKLFFSSQGNLDSVEVLNGVPGAPEYVTEARRLLFNMPRWKPATLYGKPVPYEMIIAVPFERF